MSEYDCVGVTSECLDSLKNKIAELEQQLREEKENHIHFKNCWLEELKLKHELEQQKAELIEDLKFIAEQEDAQYINDILKKHGVEI